MVYWVSFPASWKLQDVQAGLNVIIAFLCAGCIFVLVRYCWQLAARRVAAKKDVPAYTLLSLNTIGEAVDIIWLLRKDLFATRYHGLLVQCLFVILLTCATLSSGFIARFSTRLGTIVVDRPVNGSIAQRSTGSLLYADVDINATLVSLQRAKFPIDQLLEYLPDQQSKWHYLPEQWNNSWSMDCTFSPVTEISNIRATGNCTNKIWTEIPQSQQLWTQMSGFNKNWSYSYDRTGWRSNRTAYRDILMFMHGSYVDYSKNDTILDTETSVEIRTIALHLEGVPYSSNLSTGCTFSTGPVTRASYTDFRCKLTRKTGAFNNASDAYYGAFPDAYDVTSISSAYSGHWANNFRKESAWGLTTTVITGQDMAQFYQAYLITKDTSISPFVTRIKSVELRVAQISLATLVSCCIGGFIVVLGLLHYLFFVLRHWHRLDKTPQSKLDWMLQTIRHEQDENVASGNPNGMSLREKLRHSRAFGGSKNETVPLTGVVNVVNNDPDRKSMTATVHSSPEVDDGFEHHSVHSGLNNVHPRQSYGYQAQMQASALPSWVPYQPQNSYAPVGQAQPPSPYTVQQGYGVGHDQYNTAYDPGRR